MGFSTSGATAIIFVGVLIAVGLAYPVVQTAHDNRMTAIDDRDDRMLDLRNADFALEEATYEAGDESGTLTVTATNTGSTTLSVPATDLLIDGQYTALSGDDTRVDGSVDRETWQPGEELSITVAADDHPDRIKLVTEHGLAITETEVDDVE